MSGLSNRDFVAELPAHWTEKRADFLCFAARQTVEPKLMETENVWHYSIPNVQEFGEAQLEPAASIDSSKILIEQETLLVSKLNPRKKTICIATPGDDDPTVASSEFVAVQSDEIDRRYALYVWSSEKVTDRLSAIVQSVTRSHQRVNPADITKLPWRWPDIDTQRRIAGYLDDKTARIDALIEKKQALLDRLAEKRQTLITRAVTRGLNPAAQLKDSGIDWLGKVPAHWEVKPLYRFTNPTRPIRYGIVLPGPHFPDGVPIIKGGDVKPDRLTLDQLNRTDPEIEAGYARSRMKAGEIVFSIRGSYGDVEIVPVELDGCNLTQDTARISPGEGIDTHWLLYALKSHVTRLHLQARVLGSTITGVNIFDLRRVPLPVPPAVEQEEIGAYLSSATSHIDETVAKCVLSLEKLQEYRAALVTAAVTGKIRALLVADQKQTSAQMRAIQAS